MTAPARGEEPVVVACEGELATLAAALAGPGAPMSKAERMMRTIVASAVLVATRKVETARRADAGKKQEAAVKAMLREIGFSEAAPRDMPLPDAAPDPGAFCGESKLGDSRADLVIRLYDRRAMAVECKASGSAVNSFKRINHEAAGKARAPGGPDLASARSFRAR